MRSLMNLLSLYYSNEYMLRDAWMIPMYLIRDRYTTIPTLVVAEMVVASAYRAPAGVHVRSQPERS